MIESLGAVIGGILQIAVRFSIGFLTAASLVFSASAPIGVARAGADFRLDSAPVRSNATVFDGSALESGASRLDVMLDKGTHLILTATSRGKIYGDRIVLEKGAAELAKEGSYRIEASSLRVIPDSNSSVAQVELTSPKRVVVAAKAGSVSITISSGTLVARVFPGLALAFDPQANPGPTRISGILANRNGAFILEDATTKVVFEIQGGDLAKFVGKNVEVTGVAVSGATPAGGATQVIRASSVTPTGARGAGAAAAGASGGAAGAAAAGGIGGTAIAAIVGGVAVAATLGGLAAAGEFSGNPPNASTP